MRSRARASKVRFTACVGIVGLYAALSGAACSSADDDSALSKKTVTAMHDSLVSDIDSLVNAAMALQAAAPTPEGRGWDATADAQAIRNMKDAWVNARVAYEHIEGALAPIFPDIDMSIDARYDDFLSATGPDTDLFDDQGVTGLHAAERVIFADVTPANVIALEASLPGYKAAAFPGSAAEALELKQKLLGKIVSDAQLLKSQWTPTRIDLPGAYTGLVDLMKEQREKVNKAGDQEEESRYSQRTLADLRANLQGTQKIYGIFRPWILTKKSSTSDSDGALQDQIIQHGFATLTSLYASISGDAFPAPPSDWSSESPSAQDLTTPFGTLYEAVDRAVDPNQKDSVVAAMQRAGALIGVAE